MKVTIEFCPVENKFELEAAMKAGEMLNVIKNTRETLHRTIKKMQDSEEFSFAAIREVESIREALFADIEDNGLDNLIFNY